LRRWGEGSAPVVAVGIGVAWALKGARLQGAALAAAGVALFFFDVKVVPALFGEEYGYMDLYGRFGGGFGDVLLAPFAQPAYFFSQLINVERLNFLFWTLAPLGFLPLFDWRAALAALPPYLMLFLSEGDQRVRIIFHYGIEPERRSSGRYRSASRRSRAVSAGGTPASGAVLERRGLRPGELARAQLCAVPHWRGFRAKSCRASIRRRRSRPATG
jgi:hypothetical protein